MSAGECFRCGAELPAAEQLLDGLRDASAQAWAESDKRPRQMFRGQSAYELLRDKVTIAVCQLDGECATCARDALERVRAAMP